MVMFIQKTGGPIDEPEIPEESRPRVLYHYCSVEAFIGIVDSGLIRLSNSYALNDYRENTWINPFTDQKIKELRGEKTSEFLDKVIANYKFNNIIPYVASFSSESDVLSQWRAYAEDGRGIALGISPRSTGVKFRPPFTSDKTDLTLGLVPVTYDVEEQKTLVGDVLESCVEGYLNGQMDEANAIINAAIGLRRFAPLFKNPAFREEMEWRIIHTPLILGDKEGSITLVGNISELKFRTSRGKLYSHFELPMSRIVGEPPILEVVTGPKCEVSHGDLKVFLSIRGHKNLRLIASSASYR